MSLLFRHSMFRLWPLLSGWLLISACGGPRPPDPDRIHSDLLSFSTGSEAPLHEFEADELIEQRWTRGSRGLQISFQSPKGTGPWPLVLYLPGLGQRSSAGPLWREAWVKEGFAVLTVQGEREAHALSHLLPRDRLDLKSLGRPYYTLAELNQRVLDIESAFNTLEDRVRRGEAPFAKAKTEAIAIAGYDLGAQSAQALLGEAIKGGVSPPFRQKIKAGILLSPHVDVAAGRVQQRFKSITAPLLVITGSLDLDPWGISSPSVRLAAFQQAGSGHKMLVNLTQATHRQMAGIDPLSDRPEDQELDPEALDQLKGSEMQETVSRDQDNATRTASPFVAQNQSLEPEFKPHHAGQQLAAIKVISALFLSETLNRDPRAADWLRVTAGRWLGSAGTFQHR